MQEIKLDNITVARNLLMFKGVVINFDKVELNNNTLKFYNDGKKTTTINSDKLHPESVNKLIHKYNN